MRSFSTFLLLLSLSAAASSAEPAACSVVEVSTFQTGPEMARFTVSLTPAPEGVTYEWAVSSGEIVEGQNSAGIDVKAAQGSFITATVIVTGLPAGCNGTASGSRDIF